MKTKILTQVALIAALYAVLILVLAPISYGNLQVRISECLTMLPLIYFSSAYTVTLGCFLSNLVGAMLVLNPTGYIDAIIGIIATLGAVYCTYKLKDVKFVKYSIPVMLMPAILNFVFVGEELSYLYKRLFVFIVTFVNILSIRD